MAESSATIRFFGALDITRRSEVRFRFDGAEDARRVLVDLRDVDSIGSMFLVELLLFKRAIERRVAIVAPSQSMARILWPVSLDGQAAVFTSESAARRWLATGRSPSRERPPRRRRLVLVQ